MPARSFVAPVSRSEAALVIAEPDGLWKTTRNSSPPRDVLPTTEYISDVAPGTRAQDFPLFFDTCHCARGIGEPDAFASKRARAPRATATVTGCIVIRGAVAVGRVLWGSPNAVRRFGRTTAAGRATPTKPAWQARMVAVAAMPVARRRCAPLRRARGAVWWVTDVVATDDHSPCHHFLWSVFGMRAGMEASSPQTWHPDRHVRSHVGCTTAPAALVNSRVTGLTDSSI